MYAIFPVMSAMMLAKRRSVIRICFLVLMAAMIMGYLRRVSDLIPLRVFGLDHYHERAGIYREYLAAIFLWLTPFSLAAAGFLMTFDRLNLAIEQCIRLWNRLPRWIFYGVIPLLFIVWAGWTARDLTGAVPRIFDAFNYHFQARNFALGQFYAQEPPLPDLFRFPFIIIDNGKWYGSVYPGYSLLLAIGIKLGCDWMINPVLGGAGLALMYFAARDILGETQAKLVLLYGFISPFFRIMSAIFMSHAAGILWVTLSIWMLWRWSQNGKSTSPAVPFLAGCGMGWIYITRPQAGLVTIPLFLLYTVYKIRFCGWLRLAAFVLPLLVSVVFLACYNEQLTDSYFVNPRYYVDPERRLGFGDDLGEPLANGLRSGHDVSRGIRNSLLLLNLWNAEMFGFGSKGILGWLSVMVVYIFIVQWKKPLPYLLGSSILFNAILYVFYFTPSPNFGPRYFAEIIPASIFLFAAGLSDLSGRLPAWTKYRGKPVGLVWVQTVLVVMMVCVMLPLHHAHYGILPLKTERHAIPEPARPSVILISPDTYTMNIYTWNSPNLDGNIFVPLNVGISIQDIQEAFPGRDIFNLEVVGTTKKTYDLHHMTERLKLE
jgi:hypothetical protein